MAISKCEDDGRIFVRAVGVSGVKKGGKREFSFCGAKTRGRTIKSFATMYRTLSKYAIHRDIPAPRSRRKNPPAMAGMMMALAFLAREPLMICLRRFFWRPRPSATEQIARLLSLPSLRNAIVGRSSQHITQMFGPPPTADQGRCPVWYYPVSATDRLAMAISFHDGQAAIVEFFQSP